MNAVLRGLVQDNGDGVLPWLVRLFAVPGVVDFIADEVIDSWRSELKNAGLLTDKQMRAKPGWWKEFLRSPWVRPVTRTWRRLIR